MAKWLKQGRDIRSSLCKKCRDTRTHTQSTCSRVHRTSQETHKKPVRVGASEENWHSASPYVQFECFAMCVYITYLNMHLKKFLF